MNRFKKLKVFKLIFALQSSWIPHCRGIVQLHYYFEDQHNVLLLLEYASGGALFSYVRHSEVSRPICLHFKQKTMGPLGYAVHCKYQLSQIGEHPTDE